MSEQTVHTDPRQRLADRLLTQSGPSLFPTSYAQRRQWFLHELAPESSAYAMPLAFRLRGRLDLPALQDAIDVLVARHEALRTTFPAPDGRPVQRVAAEGRVPVDRRELPGASQQEIRACLREAIAQPFDLVRGPLLRVIVWRLAPEDHLLLAVAHHIVADGRSVEILLGELAAAYARRRGAGDVARLQPADHAVWEATEVGSGALEASLRYWRDELAHASADLAVPTELPRPLSVAGPAGRVSSVLPAEPLRALARKLGTTEFVVALSVFYATLVRFCGQRDVMVGVPVAGRVHPEMADMVGCFVNMLPVRLRCDGNPTARELVAHVHAVNGAALAHEGTPLDLILDAAGARRGAGPTAPLPVVFTMRDAAQTDVEFAGLTAELVEVAPPEAKLDLTCVIVRSDGTGRRGQGTVRGCGELRIEWDYRADRYDGWTIGALGDCFRAVAEQVVADPDRRIADLDLGQVAEDRDQPAGGSLLERFAHQVATRPSHPAVTDRDQVWSYQELDRRANRLAHRLRDAGVGLETPVGICLPRGAGFVVACLAVLKAGGNYVPLDPAYPAGRLRFMIADSGIELVIGDGGLADGPAVLDVADPLPGWPDTDPGVRVDPRVLCLRIYTSGSTGRPKAVGVTHGGVVELVCRGEHSGLGPDSRVLWISSVSWDPATWEIWGTLLHGGHGVVSPEREYSPTQISHLVRTHGITTAVFSTALFHALVDADVTAFQGISTLLIGGEALSPAHVRAAARALPGTRLINGYGPAEITTIATWHDITPDDLAAPSIPIGHPMSGTRITVVGPDGREVPPGAPGELWLAGSGLARGYVGRPRLTAERFMPAPGGARWYRTGDLGRAVGPDTFVYRGRVDRQVKIRGHRVEPGEVEALLAEADEVASAVVVPDRRSGEIRLIAYVVPARDRALDGFRERLRRSLPDYLVPAAVVAVAEIPRTAGGKVDTAALPRPSWTKASDRPAALRPLSGTEDAVARIWAELLDLDPAELRPTDDFFAIGGHSLLAATVVWRLAERLGVDVRLAEAFQRPTLAGFAAAVDEARVGEQPRTDRAATAPRPWPLAPSQERLWFLQLLDPHSTVYNLPLAVRISGDLDVDALCRSIRWLIDRHEVLRCAISDTPDGPVATPRPVDEVPEVTVVDVRDSGEPATAVVERELRRPFALAAGEMPIRAVLVRCGDREHLACLVVHHIAADGWSVGVIAEELGVAYAAFANGRAPALLPLDLQYADVVYRWRGAPAELDAQGRWWREALAGAPQVLDLPASRTRPAHRRLHGAVSEFALSAELVGGVRELARSTGCTEYMVLLAALSATLAARSGQEQFLIGTPVANRADPASQRLVGFFANTLALRMDTGGEPSVRALLDRVRTTCREALSHPDLPFERLVEDLAPDRDLSRSPLFQVMFAFDNTPQVTPRLPGLDVHRVRLDNPVSRVDLTVALVAGADEIAGICEYDADLFDPEDVAALLTHFRATIEGFVASPDARIAQLESPGERPALTGPPATAASGTSLLARIFGHVQRCPNRIALVDVDGRSYSYADLWDRAGRWAAWLAARDIGEGDVVGIGRRSEAVPILVGAWRRGAAVMMQPGTSGVVPEDADPGSLPATGEVTEGATAGICLARSADGREVPLRTSQAALAAAFAGVRDGTGWWVDGGSVATFLDGDPATMLLNLAGPLAAGARLTIFDPGAERLAEDEMTTVHASGPTWRSLVNRGWPARAGLHAVCVADELDPALAATLQDRDAKTWTYHSEAEALYAAVGRITSPDAIALTDVITPGRSTRVMTGRGVPAPTGIRGELWIFGADGDRAGDAGGPLRTGVLAHVDHAGRLHIDGSTPRRLLTPRPEPGSARPVGRPPRDEVETAIAAAWGEVLGDGVEVTDAHADFFALGGQSFLAARVAARLARRFGIDLGVRAIFEHPTVAGLAELLRAAPAARPDDQPVRQDESVTGAPMSFAQERLWFLAQFTPESPAYNIPLVARLDGALDREALRRAVAWVIARHETLRTRFGSRDRRPWQEVLPTDEAGPRIEQIDLTAEADPLARAVAMATEFCFTPFDLAGGEALIRLMVARLRADRHVLALAVHHLVADGWAVGLLIRDLCAAYRAYREGREPVAAPLPLRYLDYAHWQRRPCGEDALRADLDYWEGALRGAPQALNLPASHRRLAIRRHRGASIPFDVQPELAARVRALARDTGCTEFMVLFAAFATVLSRYASQREVVIGAPVANRDAAGTEALVGLLANTVALRADLSGDQTVADLLRAARTTCLDAFAHAATPFEKVVERLAPDRDQSRSPVFQIMLALNNAPPPRVELPGLECAPLEPANPTAKFDVVLSLADRPERITGVCEFDVDVYDASMIEALLGHLIRVLQAFTADPAARLSTLDMLGDSQRHGLVRAFNQTPARYDHRRCLHQLVEDATDRAPDAVAVVATGAAVSYGDLDRAANRLARLLIGHGVRPDDVVAVCADRSVELVIAEYAVLKAGAGFVPLDPAWPAGRVDAVIADAGCRLVLTGAEMRSGRAETIAIGSAGGEADTRPSVPVSPRHRAYVVYTSGSTGQPKGVQVEHGAIANNLLWMQQDWPLRPGDRMLHKTASTFDVSVKEVFWPLLSGATLVLAEPGTERDPEALLDQIDRHAITITHFVPSMLELALDAGERRRQGLGATLRYVMSGAETLSASTGRRFFGSCSADLLHMYGPTETAIAVTGWPCRRGDALPIRLPLGRPMPNCALYILDEDFNPVPPGAWGELCIGGVPVARGYLGRPADTAAAFLPDPFGAGRMYRTGDVVRLGADGLLEFRGRRDNQVKVRGFRVELGEIEAALREVPGVRNAAATASGRSQSDVGIAAYVVPDDPSQPPTSRQVRRHLRERLPEHMVPARVIVLPRLPLSTNGKIDRSALPEPAGVERDLDSEFVAPRDDIEDAVARAWSEILGVSPIGVHDDFFALGGHSLQTAEIAARLRERFDREISLRDIFAEPTVATVAELLRAAPARAAAPRIPRRRSKATTPERGEP